MIQTLERDLVDCLQRRYGKTLTMHFSKETYSASLWAEGFFALENEIYPLFLAMHLLWYSLYLDNNHSVFCIGT